MPFLRHRPNGRLDNISHFHNEIDMAGLARIRLTELTKIQAEYLGVDVAGPYKTDLYRY